MIIKAPSRRLLIKRPSVFLAGSIEMGKAEDWQTSTGFLLDLAGFTVFNPRRDDWDSSWEQSIDNPQFNEQVRWELDMLDLADCILLYLAPGTKSPISLMELGLHVDQEKIVVCCPEGFWRKGNVDILCKQYDVPVFETMYDAIHEIADVYGGALL